MSGKSQATEEPQTESGRAFVSWMTARHRLSATERADLCLAIRSIENEAVLDAEANKERKAADS